MNCNTIGNLGEAAALSYFVKEGYEVYTPFGVASTVDMVVVKDGEVKRVSVKSSAKKVESGKYEVDIRQTTRLGAVSFTKDSCDLLFLYVVPEDRFEILESCNVKNKTSITI